VMPSRRDPADLASIVLRKMHGRLIAESPYRTSIQNSRQPRCSSR
jgi:hypothetical protein